MLGALIGAGASLLGGWMNQNTASDQMAMQKKFAQNAIQWKAADAEKAGISKLYGIGAPTTSYAPVSTGGGLGSGVAMAGQNIGRALDVEQNPLTRAGGLATEIATAQLDGLKVDNDIKRAELLSKMSLHNQAGNPPALTDSETMPILPGQGNAAIKLKKEIAPAGSEPQKSFGVSPEIDMYRTKHGFSPEVPQQLGESQESQPLAAAQWFMRNKIAPGFSDAYKTFPHEPPPGYYWQFNPAFGEYTLKKGPAPTWDLLMNKLRTPKQ